MANSDWKNVQRNKNTGQYKTTDEGGGGGGSSTHAYSTTEQVVGTWIDGKPVYERTFDISGLQLPATTWVDTSYAVSDTHIKGIIEVVGANSSGGVVGIGNAIIATTDGGTTTYLKLQNLRSGVTMTMETITLRYTKTTD